MKNVQTTFKQQYQQNGTGFFGKTVGFYTPKFTYSRFLFNRGHDYHASWI